MFYFLGLFKITEINAFNPISIRNHSISLSFSSWAAFPCKGTISLVQSDATIRAPCQKCFPASGRGEINSSLCSIFTRLILEQQNQDTLLPLTPSFRKVLPLRIMEIYKIKTKQNTAEWRP